MSDVQFGVCLPIFACPGVQLFRTPGTATLDPGITVITDACGLERRI